MMTFEEISKILSGYKVGIAGCGGLGSNCAIALARVGIGNLVLADFDIVTEGNLNRQYFFIDQLGQKKALALRDNIHRVNPGIKVDARDIKLDEDNIPGIFAGCDVIVEAFDLAAMKKMIIETVLRCFPGKFLVSGNGLAGWGDSNTLRVTRHDALFICGDMVSEVADDMPPLAPRVGIVANMEANTVLEILLRNHSAAGF